jgi:phosphoribosylcarboxyaminoimidazole (NCAIR) mutase
MSSKSKEVRLILGSMTDNDKATKVLMIWKDLGIKYGTSVASCHRNIGGEFELFVSGIEQKIIVFIGGLSLAAPGIIESLLHNAKRFDHIVFAIPTDQAALSAVQDLPAGTPVITCGLNQVSLSHTLKNSALAVARLVLMNSVGERKKALSMSLSDFYQKMAVEKPLVVELDEI